MCVSRLLLTLYLCFSGVVNRALLTMFMCVSRLLLTPYLCFLGGVVHRALLTLLMCVSSLLLTCTCFSGGVFHGYLSVPGIDYPAGARSHAAGIGAGDRVLHQPQVGTPPWRKGQWTPHRHSAVGSCAFSVSGPSAWNDLPLPVWQKPSLDLFRCNLKFILVPKTIDIPCLLFRATVYIHLKSPFAACLKQV